MKNNLPKLRWKVLKKMDYIAHDLKVIERAKDRIAKKINIAGSLRVIERALERIEGNFDRLWTMLAKTMRKDDKKRVSK